MSTHMIQLQQIFDAQRNAFMHSNISECNERVHQLRRLAQSLQHHEQLIVDAIHRDFGCRSAQETQLSDVGFVLQAIRYACKYLPQWMKRNACATDISLWPARAYTLARPKGIVGIIAPWNFPLHLCLVPLVDALAAGNRVMIKPSELTPHTADVLTKIISECFVPDQVAVIIAPASAPIALAEAFACLPFDHLLFTGSESVGRKIAHFAAQNLTPVTLELGGKSPLIVGNDIAIERAAEMIGIGKLFNAGQTCIAPDYVLAPEQSVKPLADALINWVRKTYPNIVNNPHSTSIISTTHYQRLRYLVDNAIEEGVTTLAGEIEGDLHRQTKKFPFTVLINPPSNSRVLHEEIFGPVLPIVSYRTIEEALDFIRARPHPLAAYILFSNTKKGEKILQQICSGSSSVNAPLLQQTVNSLPFGGVGTSGIGCYHGKQGFLTFSHNQSFLISPAWHLYRHIKPPFGMMYSIFKNLLFRRT